MKRRRGTRFTNHTQVSSADFMGRAKVELAPLKNQRLRKWFPLSADSEGKKGSSNVTGDLELVVQWRHNPALAFAPFSDEVEVPEGKKPNELRVAAIQARRLAVKDKSMMGKGSSDPVVTFELGSVKAETTVKKKTLNPTWKEAFAKPCSVDEAGDCQLKVTVGDWDAVTSRDFMGSCVIDLKGCVEAPNQPACRKWCLLDLQDDKKTQNVSGGAEIDHYSQSHFAVSRDDGIEGCNTYTATPSSRRRVDGVEVMIRRAAKFDFYTGLGRGRDLVPVAV